MFSLVFAEGLAQFDPKQIDWVKWKVMFTPLQFRSNSRNSWRKLRAELALQDLVVVCGWHKWYYIRTLVFCKLHNIPTMIFYESIQSTHKYNGLIVQKIRHQILNLGNYLLAPSPQVLATLELHGVPTHKIIPCVNPIDVDRISEFVDSTRTKFLENQHKFVYIGQLIERKNLVSLLHSFSDPSFDDDLLTIVGEGELREDLQRLIIELNLQNRVKMIPYSPEDLILNILGQNQTLVLPSVEEVWGMVAAEALAGGLGVVVSENAGIAASISEFEGVQICSPTISDLRVKMQKAKLDWRPIFDRSKLEKFRPEHFCELIIERGNGNHRYLHTTLQEKKSSREVFRRHNPQNWLWVTNIPSNYRLAIWNQMPPDIRLHVICVDQPSFSLIDSQQDQQAVGLGSESNVRKGFLGLIKILTKTFRAEILIVGGWHRPTYFISVLVRRFFGKPTFIHYGSTTRTHQRFNFILRLVRNRIMNSANGVITYGDTSFRSLIFDGMNRAKLFPLFNPVDSNYINLNVKRLRKNFPPTPGHKFLFVGQIVSRKGVMELLQAFNEIRDPGDSLTIVGEGNLSGLVSQRIRELGLIDSIQLVPQMEPSALLQMYARNQTLVLPSTTEVWGLVVNEALAAQLNVVVSSKSGVAESLKGIEKAFVYGDDYYGLVQAMRESREHWTGWDDEVFILENDTRKFASELVQVLHEWLK